MKPGAARLIPAIHACRRKVAGLEEDGAWRAFLARHGGGESLRAMTGPQLGAVLDALHAAGAPRKAGKGAGARRLADDAQSRMIRGLWIELAAIGEVRDRSEAGLAAFARRQTGVSALQWLSAEQANAVIEALKSWRDRAAALWKADRADPRAAADALWAEALARGIAHDTGWEGWGHAVTGLGHPQWYEEGHWRRLLAALRRQLRARRAA